VVSYDDLSPLESSSVCRRSYPQPAISAQKDGRNKRRPRGRWGADFTKIIQSFIYRRHPFDRIENRRDTYVTFLTSSKIHDQDGVRIPV
jgi:hypothetical protein